MALKGANNPEQIWNFLIDKGLSSTTTAAIMGNIYQESKYNNLSENKSTGVYGICQWRHGRYDGLVEMASSMGKPISDLEVQLNWLWKELTSTEAASLAATQGAGDDLERQTVTFRKKFERCGEAEANDSERIRAAKEAFQKQGKGIKVDGTYNASEAGVSAMLEGLGGLNLAGLGFEVRPAGPEVVTLIKLPHGKTTPCEPVYPDLITVSDTVPQWVLDATVVAANQQARDELNGKATSQAMKELDQDKKDAEAYTKFKDEQFVKWLEEKGHGYTNEAQLKQCKELYEQAAKAEADKFVGGVYVGTDAKLKTKAEEFQKKEKERNARLSGKSEKKDEKDAKEKKD